MAAIDRKTSQLQNTAKSFADAIQSNVSERELREEEDKRDSSAEELKQWDKRFQKKDKG